MYKGWACCGTILLHELELPFPNIISSLGSILHCPILGTDRILQARAGRRCQRRGGRPGADPIGSTWAHGVVGETRSDLEPSCEQAAACRRVIGQQQASERARGGRPFPPARSEARARTPPRNPNPCTRKKMQWQQYSIKTF